MFTGTTPPEVRNLLNEVLKEYKGKDVYIGCSGNFTVDRLAHYRGFNVRSNDVSLYSKIASDVLLHKESKFEIEHPVIKEIYDSWEPSRYKDMIIMLLVIKLSDFKKLNNEFVKTYWNYYVDNSKQFYDNTIEKFEKNEVFNFEIKDYFDGDFVEHIRNKRGTGLGILFPPTYKGGYEKLFAFIDEVFVYEEAKYEMFEPEEADELFREFLEEDENIIYTDHQLKIDDKHLLSKLRIGGGKKDIFIYSSFNNEKKYFIEKKKNRPEVNMEVLEDSYEFTKDSVVKVYRVNKDIPNHYKQLYMSAKVNYTEGGDFGIMFTVDEKVFGFASMSKMLSTNEKAFIQSDFVVNSDQKQLSKLILILLKSKEIRKLINREFKHFYLGLKTSVYTDKPMSMKYRGPFKKTMTEPNKKTGINKLVYECEYNNKTIQQNFEEWLKRIKKQK